MMKIYSFIPARGGSKGIPNKNICPILGEPLLLYSLKHSINTKAITKTFVSTDSKEIADLSLNNGASVIDRPKEISGDFSTTEQALKHFLNIIDEKPDLVVFLQATSPVRRKDDISNAINRIIDKGADSLFSSRKIEGFIWKDNIESIKPINYEYGNRPMRQELKIHYKEENGSIYIFKPKILEKYNSRLGGIITDYPMDLLSSAQVDSLNDIQVIEDILINLRSDF